ncbi:MAG: pyridoxal phosphate-dependent aminotransferase [Planctomycetota bacterium]|jgi:hypothetical protein|nr:pyridoxal phosphate-dependent aminotransferase [Planctomycetota bacterium]
MTDSSATPHGFRPVPRTGVIYVMTEATRCGFVQDRSAWANLGQGAPEISPLPDAPARLSSFEIPADDQEYSPVVGMPELRDAVARLYNERYRRGKSSQYTRENVAISAGGRLALTRLVSTIGHTNVGHFLPDYTAYEELLDSFGSFVPIPILAEPDVAYEFSAQQLEREILGRGLSAVLLSNPCNPTGRLICGEPLREWVATACGLECTLIFDEFYSHYVYGLDRPSVSAAEFIDDVNEDSVVIIDGLTKNWRYPGMRVSWTVGPAPIIDLVASAGSFLDGGCSRPMQVAATPLLEPEIADREALALQATFTHKREVMLAGLRDLGVVVEPSPAGAFYCWGDLRGLPEGRDTGMLLFRKALEEKVVLVPGVFFDINPGKRRPDRASRYGHFARFSFGPPLAEIERGLEALRKII